MQGKATPQVYRVRAVADMFDVGTSTIYRAIESGRLKALKVGEGKGSIRITQDAIDAYWAACEQVAGGAGGAAA